MRQRKSRPFHSLVLEAVNKYVRSFTHILTVAQALFAYVFCGFTIILDCHRCRTCSILYCIFVFFAFYCVNKLCTLRSMFFFSLFLLTSVLCYVFIQHSTLNNQTGYVFRPMQAGTKMCTKIVGEKPLITITLTRKVVLMEVQV